jgi:plastocyanin
MKRPLLGLAVLAGVTALAVAPATAGTSDPTAQAARTKTVQLGDNYYAPVTLKVHKGDYVRWRWPDVGFDSHDVKLKKGPSGAKKFQSEFASSAYSYKRRLTVLGTYRIICTFHQEEMFMTIKVIR